MDMSVRTVTVSVNHDSFSQQQVLDDEPVSQKHVLHDKILHDECSSQREVYNMTNPPINGGSIT